MTSESHLPIISLEGVGKRYRKYEDTPMLLTGLVRFGRRRHEGTLWAVRDVSAEVRPGEALGVIGRNGSGKSTLLTMCAGVTAPTEGIVRVRGRVAPLLQVGIGFHPELSGRENVYVNATILGLSRREIDDAIDGIIEFAELEEFIDTPTKFYSSGMRVRLGFATAVAVRPDAMLVDEVLAVGDLGFQMKCYERMLELKESGTSFLVVSHDLDAVRRICDSVLLLHDGEPRFLGPTVEAISEYHKLFAGEGPHQRHGTGDRIVEIHEVETLNARGQYTHHFRAHEEATFRSRLCFHRSVDRPNFGLILDTDSGQTVYFESTLSRETRRVEPGEWVTCEVRVPLRLVSGNYRVNMGVSWGRGSRTRALSPTKSFFVSGRDYVRGVADLEARFTIEHVQK